MQASFKDGPSSGAAYLIYALAGLVYMFPALMPGFTIFGTDYIEGSLQTWMSMAQRLQSAVAGAWFPELFGGIPHLAAPGSSFYPPHLLGLLLLPTERVLPAIFALHFGLGGLGMYRLVRELDGARWTSFWAGSAWAYTGMITSWIYAGHDGRFIVASLAPLALALLRRGVRTGRISAFSGFALVLGSAFLTFQIQSSYYLLLAALLWGVFCLFDLKLTLQSATRRTALAFVAVTLAFGLAAVIYLPFAGFVEHSVRSGGGRGYEYATSFSLPPSDLKSALVPEAVGSNVADPTTGRPMFPAYRGENPLRLHTEYLGAVVGLLLLLGLTQGRPRPVTWFFAGLGGFYLVLALGGHTPLYRIAYEFLPGLALFRAPGLAFYIAALAAVVLAALALEKVEMKPERVLMAGGGLLALVLLLSHGAEDASLGAGRALLVGAVAVGLLWARGRKLLPPPDSPEAKAVALTLLLPPILAGMLSLPAAAAIIRGHTLWRTLAVLALGVSGFSMLPLSSSIRHIAARGEQLQQFHEEALARKAQVQRWRTCKRIGLSHLDSEQHELLMAAKGAVGRSHLVMHEYLAACVVRDLDLSMRVARTPDVIWRADLDGDGIDDAIIRAIRPETGRQQLVLVRGGANDATVLPHSRGLPFQIRGIVVPKAAMTECPMDGDAVRFRLPGGRELIYGIVRGVPVIYRPGGHCPGQPDRSQSRA